MLNLTPKQMRRLLNTLGPRLLSLPPGQFRMSLICRGYTARRCEQPGRSCREGLLGGGSNVVIIGGGLVGARPRCIFQNKAVKGYCRGP